jgi:hypothetical protein
VELPRRPVGGGADRHVVVLGPYVEIDDETGRVAYVEHHRTLGDWVSLLAPRFRIVALLEPEWPENHDRVWGGWSRVRGRLTPGTAVFAADLSDSAPRDAQS